MAQRFSFSKRFNKEKIFNIDTTNFDYVSLEEMYQDDDIVYPVRGIYLNEKSLYDPAPVIATDSYYVNLPSHMYQQCKEILGDRIAINEINKGCVGFIIYRYEQKRFNKICYSIRWVDVNPDDFKTEETTDIEG